MEPTARGRASTSLAVVAPAASLTSRCPRPPCLVPAADAAPPSAATTASFPISGPSGRLASSAAPGAHATSSSASGVASSYAATEASLLDDELDSHIDGFRGRLVKRKEHAGEEEGAFGVWDIR
jgi:hypothetical protein